MNRSRSPYALSSLLGLGVWITLGMVFNSGWPMPLILAELHRAFHHRVLPSDQLSGAAMAAVLVSLILAVYLKSSKSAASEALCREVLILGLSGPRIFPLTNRDFNLTGHAQQT